MVSVLGLESAAFTNQMLRALLNQNVEPNGRWSPFSAFVMCARCCPPIFSCRTARK